MVKVEKIFTLANVAPREPNNTKSLSLKMRSLLANAEDLTLQHRDEKLQVANVLFLNVGT
ncbi:hypothetical protein [Calothrix sp. UHCC 0171]|uniref:hypothetical protein n=1 Tax=Calothrix sp. UHCC 0171 TaxID=3110245 RepID=UPI002B20A345|nr:hypothetical protein [Calothrix sp. UHCC 0171]MEA5569847.1 hypothetical protein [Calothrix sp. UHCC 0171]